MLLATALFFETTWVKPESLQAIGREIGSNEINGFTRLIDKRQLQREALLFPATTSPVGKPG